MKVKREKGKVKDGFGRTEAYGEKERFWQKRGLVKKKMKDS